MAQRFSQFAWLTLARRASPSQKHPSQTASRGRPRSLDVRGEAVEEEAVVADDDGAAGKLEQRFLERAHRVNVEVVGGLVEKQHVAVHAQHLGELHAVALAAGEVGDTLLLVARLEAEPARVGAPLDGRRA
eukprot:2623788-Pleurochrysis_carterae.AAC.1